MKKLLIVFVFVVFPALAYGQYVQPAYMSVTEKGSPDGVATLNGSSKVVQDPANAQAAAAQGKIPIAGVGGALDSGWLPTVPVSKGGTGLTSTAPHAVVTGGATGTGNLQQVSGLGSAGQVLTSQGVGALPAWANAPAGTVPDSGTTAGVILKGDGAHAWSVGQPGTLCASIAKSSNYTITDTDGYTTYWVSGNTTITLPAASTRRRIYFKKTDIGTTTVTIVRAGTDTIEGVTSITLVQQYDSVVLESDGSATWYKF